MNENMSKYGLYVAVCGSFLCLGNEYMSYIGTHIHPKGVGVCQIYYNHLTQNDHYMIQ